MSRPSSNVDSFMYILQIFAVHVALGSIACDFEEEGGEFI
jgi:hypothetical protein